MSPWTEERRAQTISLFRAGLDNNEIAREIGLRPNQVSGRLAAMGLKREDPHLHEKITRPNSLKNAALKAKAKRRGSIRPRPGCKPLEERGPRECAWPFGEVPSIVFCSQPVAERNGKRTCYCSEHLLKMWRRREETDVAK